MAIVVIRSTTIALVIGLVVLDLALRVSTTEAHGGVTVARTAAGPYRVEATVSRSGGRIDETIVVLDNATLEAAAVEVAVTLVGRNGEQRGPFVGRPSRTGFEVLYPPPEGDSGWRVRIDVVGPAGPAEVEHPYKAPGREWVIGSGAWGLVLAILGIALPVGIMLLLLRPQGRRSGTTQQAANGTKNGGVA